MVIINADDFGIAAGANGAIAECFELGLISSTTLMANMPGFEEACALARQRHLESAIGVHLNITQGPPLSGAIRACPRFCGPDAQFHFQRRRSLRLSGPEEQALAAEFRAQIERCRQCGLPLTHADSHHHAHTVPAVMRVLLPVLRSCGIRRVRLTRNRGVSSRLDRLLKYGFNLWLRAHRLRTTRFLGGLRDFEATGARPRAAGWFEIMVHPDRDSRGEILDSVDQEPLVSRLRRVSQNATLSSYAGLD